MKSQTKEKETKYAVFNGPGDIYAMSRFGIKFKHGVVYPINEEMEEYLKGIRGFVIIDKISKSERKFPRRK